MSQHPPAEQPTGRPSTYTPELADSICAALTDGKSMRQIEQLDGMPSARTVYRWLRENEAFRQQYAGAREEQADHMLWEILTISDDNSRDAVEIEIAPGVKVMQVDQDVIQRSKLRVDTRKWAMSKLAPKKYGDKLDLTSGGEKLPATPRVFQILPASQRPLDAGSQEPEPESE